MKNDLFSRFRYDNTFDLKFRSNDQETRQLLGAEVKFSNNIPSTQTDKQIASSSWGITWVMANVFKTTRITDVDGSIISPSYKGPTYFKMFKFPKFR